MSAIKCNNASPSMIFNISDSIYKAIEPLESQYQVKAEEIICSLTIPPKNYYLRVNILKSNKKEVIEELKKGKVEVFNDLRYEELIFFKIKQGNRLSDQFKYVIAKREAAERVMLGSNLYIPGVLKIHNARKGDYVSVITKEGHIVANGYLKINPDELGKHTKGVAVEVKESIYVMPKINELEVYQQGKVADQSFPSFLLMKSYPPKNYDFIVDLTASPGGKISHAYELTRGMAKYIAIDHTSTKILKLENTLKRLGHVNVKLIRGDSRFAEKLVSLDKPTFTILDPPCTGLGNRPRLDFSFETKNFSNLIRLQRSLLSEAIRITTPGGIILYSTCTLTEEENEGNIEWAMKNFPVEVIEPEVPYPQSRLADFPCARFVPGYHDYSGFFFVILKKI